MRCQQCAASNPDAASWCGQCFASFAEPPAVAQPTSQPEAEQPTEDHASVMSQVGAARPGPARARTSQPGVTLPDGADAEQSDAEADVTEVSATGFRRRNGELEWLCVTCGQFNSVDLVSCAVCGTSMAARFEQPEERVEPSSWGAAFALSALLPGTGHYLAGRLGSAFARGLLYVIWLVGGLLLLLTAGRIAVIAAAPLFLGAFVVWAGTLYDLSALQRDDREVLAGRVLLWVVVGVTAMLLLAAFAGAMQAR
jgi:hypothetical protein